jgi:hypothetical protein
MTFTSQNFRSIIYDFNNRQGLHNSKSSVYLLCIFNIYAPWFIIYQRREATKTSFRMEIKIIIHTLLIQRIHSE